MTTLTFPLRTILALCFVCFFSKQSLAGEVSDFKNLLNQHKGQVIYVDFWASWCVPCRKSFPWMNNMQKKYQDQGFKVITVNVDADKINATNFLSLYPANFEVFYDPKGKIATEFKLPGMPSSFVINRAGKIVSGHVGFNDDKKIQYEKEITQLLVEQQ